MNKRIKANFDFMDDKNELITENQIWTKPQPEFPTAIQKEKTLFNTPNNAAKRLYEAIQKIEFQYAHTMQNDENEIDENWKTSQNGEIVNSIDFDLIHEYLDHEYFFDSPRSSQEIITHQSSARKKKQENHLSEFESIIHRIEQLDKEYQLSKDILNWSF